LSIKLFSATIFLDYHIGDFVNPFVTRKAPSAVQAFSASTNYVPFPTFPGIYYFIFQMTTKRTFHCKELLSWDVMPPATEPGLEVDGWASTDSGSIPNIARCRLMSLLPSFVNLDIPLGWHQNPLSYRNLYRKSRRYAPTLRPGPCLSINTDHFGSNWSSLGAIGLCQVAPILIWYDALSKKTQATAEKRNV